MTTTQKVKGLKITTCADCHGCGTVLVARHLYMHDSHLFCSRCMLAKGLKQCEDCHEWVKKEDSRSTYDNRIICISCRENNYFYCDHCEELHHDDDMISDEEHAYCRSCVEEYYFRCSACEQLYSNDESNEDDRGNIFCPYCWRKRRMNCACCGQQTDHLTEFRLIGSVCKNCIPKTKVSNYSFKPTPIFFGKGKFFLGIELEVHCANLAKTLKALNEERVARLYVKEDGSVHHGFEIVSHPMTIEEHRAFNWLELCDTLYESGAVGNLENHGVHVHISKQYLSENERLKLSWFMCNHIKEIVKLARREHCYNERRDVEEIKDSLKKKTYTGGRTEILNWSPPDTVEFRLPLSTLRGETLLAILEFCDAAVKFSQTDISFMQCRNCWSTFLDWCNKNGYKCLVGYYIMYGDKGYVER